MGFCISRIGDLCLLLIKPNVTKTEGFLFQYYSSLSGPTSIKRAQIGCFNLSEEEISNYDIVLSMKFRKYTKEDKSSVNEIFRLYWTDSEFLEELNTELEKVDFWVAEENGEIIGVLGTRPAPKYLGDSESLELYIIASKTKEKGLGSALLKYVEKQVPEKYKHLVLYSPETHESSWGFYERNGFESGGIIKDPEDGYPGILWKKSILGK